MANRKRAIPQYGTVTLNGLDYYRTRVQDADGKLVALYARTPEELYDKELNALEQIDNDTFCRKSPTVAEYCEKWLLMQSVHVRATTMTDYTSKVRRHIIKELGDMRMADVTLDDIQLALVPVSKKSASVYKSVVVLCKSIFRAAKESRIIENNPTVYLTSKGGGVPQKEKETGSMEPLHTATHEITFDNVDFAYVPGEPVLKHATFTVPDQKLTAIVGDSGSGKSTILNLIAKYYEATSGTISIGGKPINHIAAERVLEQVSMVDQDVFLFDDTIRDNIRHARPNATDTEIEAACREANCDSFIRKMEKGYDTPTGENGNLLSGGERQRISIARAILKNSPILLLDEATASLDIENELAVKQAIANLLKEKKTVVMIAHTLSIVKNADQILVMGDGRIAESGTHEELLAKGGKYAAMWNAEQKISA